MALFGIPTTRSSRPAQPAPRGAAQLSAADGGLASVQGPPASSPRELRAQVVHRLQIGLFGLAGMLLLVSLASVILDRAHMADTLSMGQVDPMASASASPASDPLVDMGVAPEVGANKPAPSASQQP